MYNEITMKLPFARWFGSETTKAATTAVRFVASSPFFTGFDHHQDIANLNSYKESLYLYIAVSKITRRGAGVPLELYRLTNTAGDSEELLEHELLDVFNNPNPIMTRREFFEVSLAHYLLSGDCFWALARTGNRVTGMIPLRPDYVEIVLSKERTEIVGYEYRHAETVRFAPQDVVHIKNIDPTNMLRGVGAIRPASQRIVSEKEASRFQAQLFKNNGMPSVLVFLDQDLTGKDEEIAQARAKWKRTFKEDGEQVGFFGNNTKDVKSFSTTPKEMDFTQSQEKLRNDILAAFGVPLPMVDLKDIERANSREAYRMFLQEAVIPALDAFEDAINHRLVSQVDESVFVTFPDPTPFDRETALQEATQLKKAGIITANEARALFNYEPMDGHDDLQETTASPFEAGEASKRLRSKAKNVLRSRPVQYLKMKAAEDIASALSLPAGPKREMKSIFATKELKQSYAKAYNTRVDKRSDTYADTLNAFHQAQLDRLLKRNADGWTTDNFMDLAEETRLAKQTFRPVAERLYTDGGQETLQDLFRAQKGVNKALDDFFADPVLLQAIAERVELFSESIIKTTYDILQRKIREGVENGDGIDKIGRSIRDYYTDMEVKRARTIARTETGFILSKATNDAYMQSSIVTGKEWITVGDEKVRDEHVENDGVIVAKGGVFPSGEEYPAHKSINCRCVLAPAV